MSDSEIPMDEQALYKLRLEEEVDKLIREAILRAFNDSVFVTQLRGSVFSIEQVASVLTNHNFKRAVINTVHDKLI
jgi:hypothetical protein